MMSFQRRPLRLSVVLLLFASPLVQAQEGADALAKQLSNPIASLTSVPLQLNYEDGIGPSDDGYKFTLNVQPVIPVSISADWNMISRTILPIVSQQDVFPQDDSQFGLGDTVQSLFFTQGADRQRLDLGLWTGIPGSDCNR